MSVSNQRTGEILILTQTLLWSLFPIVTVFSLNQLPPMTSLAYSTLLGAVFFGSVLTAKRKWHELGNLAAYRDTLGATLFIGVLYYIFIFWALRYTSAGNVSIIGGLEIFTSYLFFQVWQREAIPGKHIWGAVLIILGSLIVLSRNLTSFNLGDVLVILACIVAPFGNFFQQRARKQVSSETILFIRSLVSGVVIFIFALLTHESQSLSAVRNSWLFLVVNGLFLLGFSKLLWLEGIHRINVTKAGALSSISPVLTLFFAWLLLRDNPTSWQFLAFIPVVIGMILLSTKSEPKVVS